MNSVSSKSYLTEEKSRLLFNSVTSPGMTDLYKGRPRGYQQVETVSVETEVTFDMRGVTYNGNKSLEEQKQTIFFKDIMRNARMEKLNFEQCSLIGCNVLAYKLRHNASSGLTPVGLQLNFEHKGMGDHIDLFNRIAETVTPGIGGMFLEVQNPNDEWKTLPIPASPFLSLDKTKGIFGYVNAHFQSTYCLANADNITNGIVIIPPEACHQFGLPVFKGAPPPPNDYTGSKEEWERDYVDIFLKQRNNLNVVTHWAVIPVDHVAAWGLNSDSYAAKYRLSSEKLFVRKSDEEGVLMYHVVDNNTLNRLLEFCRREKTLRTDFRDFRQMAFQCAPLVGRGGTPTDDQFNLSVSFKVALQFCLPRRITPEQQKTLAIAIHDKYPSASHWGYSGVAEYEQQIQDMFAKCITPQGFQPPRIEDQ